MKYPRLISEGSVWIVATIPSIWAGHFLLCYWVAAVWCAKFSGTVPASLTTPRWIIAALTALSLGAIAFLAYRALHSYGGTFSVENEINQNTSHDRKRFLGHVSLLLAALSAIAICFTAAPALVFARCW
ncbi:hypothetical protein SAMN05421688_2942 [Poseidonocella pacifica]|uniref:Transmembrane protein n=1 Tax=Poseidonocella pacifica TaxID=871651 RepID=A0A1I0YFG6_9RHOB|nr:hypothetical protein [Poseidonocella pacifica]SFB11118.1 hypothetical protein SAMN05421688_2942 [Poseidonocella pacifica]